MHTSSLLFWRKQLPIGWVAAIVAILNLVLYNIPFFHFVIAHAEMSMGVLIGLMISLILLMLVLHYWFSYLALKCCRGVGRGLIALLMILSATCVYFVVTYHNLMDDTMMSNVFHTRFSEASAFFNLRMWLWIFGFGVLPAVWIGVQRIAYGSWKRLGVVSGLSLGSVVLLLLLNMNQVLWIGKYDTELGGLIMPWSYVVNTGRLWAQQSAQNAEAILLPDGQWETDEPAAMVLVIGESSRRANWQLYGYPRPTNPRLYEVQDLHIYQAKACATYTTAGVKAILEDDEHSALYEILPNYLARMGADVEWRTSNWGEPPVKGAVYRTRQQMAEQYGIQSPYDEVLLMGLKSRIEQSTSAKVLIVLHTSTSHGPDYQLQYPAAFECFTPNNLIHAYDNTIVYTDYLLRQIVDTLSTITSHRCAMLYISDHGESLGENDLFMHGVPMRIAPATQYEIPCLLWGQKGALSARDIEKEVDQHYVFSTVLHWLGVSSPIYDSERDLFDSK